MNLKLRDWYTEAAFGGRICGARLSNAWFSKIYLMGVESLKSESHKENVARRFTTITTQCICIAVLV
jgi:hypothetical protein